MYKTNRRYVLSALLLVGVVLTAAIVVPAAAKYRQREAQRRFPWAKPRTAPALRAAAPDTIAKAFPGDSRATLEAGEMTLFSVDPYDFVLEEARTGTKATAFHRRAVREKVVLNREESRLVLASLDDALAPVPGSPIVGAMQCFEPRHGVRVVNKATGKRVDILICFSCHNAYLYRGTAGGSEEKDVESTFTAFGPAAGYHLNDLLRKHDLPVAP